jgi:hypothetical protein
VAFVAGDERDGVLQMRGLCGAGYHDDRPDKGQPSALRHESENPLRTFTQNVFLSGQ